MPLNNSRLNTWLEQHYRFTAVVLVVLLVAIGYWFLLWPQYQQLHDSGVLQYETTLAAVRQRQQYLTSLQAMSDDYSTLNHRLFQAISQLIPNTTDQTTIFAEMQSLFAQTPFTIASINLASGGSTSSQTSNTNTTISKNIQSKLISVNVTGPKTSYQELKKLLTNIETHAHVLNLQSLTFTPNSDTFTFVFQTYQHVQL